MPLQKPHPPIWIPGVASPESVVWAAKHGYPYVALAPPLQLLSDIYRLYQNTRRGRRLDAHAAAPGLRRAGCRGRQRTKRRMRKAKTSTGSWEHPSA